jgi:hypothetical protein
MSHITGNYNALESTEKLVIKFLSALHVNQPYSIVDSSMLS